MNKYKIFAIIAFAPLGCAAMNQLTSLPDEIQVMITDKLLQENPLIPSQELYLEAVRSATPTKRKLFSGEKDLDTGLIDHDQFTQSNRNYRIITDNNKIMIVDANDAIMTEIDHVEEPNMIITYPNIGVLIVDSKYVYHYGNNLHLIPDLSSFSTDKHRFTIKQYLLLMDIKEAIKNNTSINLTNNEKALLQGMMSSYPEIDQYINQFII